MSEDFKKQESKPVTKTESKTESKTEDKSTVKIRDKHQKPLQVAGKQATWTQILNQNRGKTLDGKSRAK